MTPTLTIDLCAIARNWQRLCDIAPGAETGATVKANAYGLGAEPVTQALAEIGARSFFTATFAEAVEVATTLRRMSAIGKDWRIIVLNGIGPADLTDLKDWPEIIPSAGSLPQLHTLAETCPGQPIALQVETGINRVGLQFNELDAARQYLDKLSPQLIFNQLACADEPDHPLNARQLEQFRAFHAALPDVPASLCNSAGIMLGDSYHFDLTRPGCALYGLNPRITPDHANPFDQVIELTAPLIRIKTIRTGESVGYSASYTATDGPRRIGTLSLGYADGIQRIFGNQSVSVLVAGHPCPIIGRVSMDLTTIDLTQHPDGDHLSEGDAVDLLSSDPRIQPDTLGLSGGTIGYEVLTSLGQRYKRTYLW
ncbi:MAG: alanine racemase [Alphaproteobacteria bacterium]